MMKQMITAWRVRPSRCITLPALALLAVLLLPAAARAQWTTNGGNTITTTPNSVGVGTVSPTYGKLQVNKSVRIDDDTASTSGSDTINAAPSLYLGTTGGGGQLQYNAGGGLDLWQYNGTWRRTITFARTGFVGIGTTSPLNQFHVDGGSSAGGIRVSGWSAGMGFRDNGAGADAKLYQWRSEGGLFRMALVNDAESDFVRQNILVANAAGNVGVGTAPSAASRLHVLGGSLESQFSTVAGQGYGLFVARDNNHFVENAYLDGASGQWRAIQTGKSAMLSTNTAGGNALTVAADDAARAAGEARGYAPLLTIRMDGKVGIGNPAPADKLDVAGRVRSSSGGFVFPDGSVQTTASGWAGGGATLSTANAAARVGVGTASPAVKLAVGGAGVNVIETDAWVENNLHVQGPESLSGNTDRGRLRVGTAWGYAGLYSDTSSAGRGNDLVLGASSGTVRVGSGSGAQHLIVPNGDITASGTIKGGKIEATYQDVAEWVPSVQKLAPGTVVILDAGRVNHVMASAGAYDTKVAGVVSAEPGVILGVAGEGKVKVATTGRVKVKVDATRGAIKVGDLLVTGGAEGVAMKSVPVDLGGVPIHRPGTIIGKALEPLESGMGEILVLLSLQ